MSNEENISAEARSRTRSGTIGVRADCSEDKITKITWREGWIIDTD
jgi:hypothetical protein